MSFLRVLFTLTLITLFVSCYDYKSDCSCPSWNGGFPDPSYSAQPSSGLTKSQSEEVIAGVSWGYLNSYARAIWLGKDAAAQRSTSKMGASCPSGYRVPTGEELRNLLAAAKISNPADPKAFLVGSLNFNVSAYYVSSEKAFPNITNGGDNNAWVFQMLYFKSGGQPVIENVSTYWNANKLASRCVLDTASTSSGSSLVIEGAEKRFFTNQPNVLKVVKNNLQAHFWKINEVASGNMNSVEFLPARAGCHVIDFYAAFFGGVVLRKCAVVWADIQTGSEAETTFSPSKLSVRNISDIKAILYNSMTFSTGSSPIAPKKDGGAYILFARQGDNALNVRTVDNNGVDTAPVIALNRFGLPLDITATPWGFVSLIVDKPNDNKLYVLGTYANGGYKFETTIMNNGASPTNATDQIKFFESNGNLPFGMAAMYRPHNGRLSFLRNRIFCIFAHYNHFGLTATGARNDHTGDTVINFDENGSDIRLGWAWGASHSLVQNVAVTEDKILTASLGDAYPQNIRYGSVDVDANANIDPITKTNNRVNSAASSTILSGSIPGNGAGKACGNIGGLSYMNNNVAVASYTRKACNTTFNGVTTVSDKNEVGILAFDKNLKKIGEYPLANGSLVHIIKSAKYGRNILLAIGATSKASTSFLPTSVNYAADTLSFLVVTPDGRVVTQSTNVSPFSLTPADEWRVLNDGSIAWALVGTDGFLKFYKVSL